MSLDFTLPTSLVRVERTLRDPRVRRATVFSGLALVLELHTMLTASWKKNSLRIGVIPVGFNLCVLHNIFCEQRMVHVAPSPSQYTNTSYTYL